MRWIITTIICMATLTALSADERAILKEMRALDPDSPDIIGQFKQVGPPKHTDIEKKIIARAQKMQDEHTAIFDRIEMGKSVFDYPGLIARGTIRYDLHGRVPYALTIGIRPHIPEFAGSFAEYKIEFDDKGIVQGKSKVSYSWKKTALDTP